MSSFILAIDQGTTSTRALVFDATGNCRGSAAREIIQYYPSAGLVEHDPQQIWETIAEVVPSAMDAASTSPREIAAVGITNQRETVVAWDRHRGKPLARALVWQDRRTADFCRQHKEREDWLRQKTGLVLDPYFSATKLRWLLDNVTGLRARAAAGEVLAGTIDSWLIWNLTGGQVHATDQSNASRTLLFNLHRAAWDPDLLDFFGIPPAMLPQSHPSAHPFGRTRGLSFLPDGLPITGVAGDQQAALFGQGGFRAGAAKCTYGTGAFFLRHTGGAPILSRHRLLASLAATTSAERQYVLEGSVFVAGAAVQWLRDNMRFIPTSPDVEALAAQSDPGQPVVFVPGFVGLGAPHWAPEARGVIFGLTRATTAADLARAALEGVALQVADLVDAAGADTGQPLESLNVDGGMARNAWFLQAQADVLGIPVRAATQSEATALGAAFLAGLQAGFWPDCDALARLVAPGQPFEPRLTQEERSRRRRQWQRAVRAVIDYYSPDL